jgi:hypothetical protein
MLRVKQTDDFDLVFEGVKLAGADSKWIESHKKYQLCKLELYRSSEGKYIFSEVHNSEWHGDKYGATVFDSLADLQEYFTYHTPNNIVKHLLELAGDKDAGLKGIFKKSM